MYTFAVFVHILKHIFIYAKLKLISPNKATAAIRQLVKPNILSFVSSVNLHMILLPPITLFSVQQQDPSSPQFLTGTIPQSASEPCL